MRNIFLAVLFATSMIYGEPNNSIDKKDTKRQRIKAVTYGSCGGRFGDQFLGYLHAKWIAYKYHMLLLYKPFMYSDRLVLHYEETLFCGADNLRFPRVVKPSVGNVFDYSRNIVALYEIPYFPESKWEITNSNEWYYFSVDWKDEGFRQEIKRLIRPINPTFFLELPTNRITVAVHVRKGGGFDDPDTWRPYPMKFGNDRYYIDQIKKIYEIFQGAPLYVYLFTDDQNPLQIVQKYQSHLFGMDVQFDCRKEGNHHSANVVEDFFEMTRFDCLIRADSNYSFVASKIGDYKVVISPAHFIQNGNTLDTIYVDEVEIEVSASFLEKYNQ